MKNIFLLILFISYSYANLAPSTPDDGKAAYIEGMMYFKGIHYAQDNQKALTLIQQSAAANHAKAQYQLATFYYKGITVTKDTDKAVYWLRKSANQGYQEAQMVLDSLPEGLRNKRISPPSDDLITNIELLRQEIEQSLIPNNRMTQPSLSAETNQKPTGLNSDIEKLKLDIETSLATENPASHLTSNPTLAPTSKINQTPTSLNSDIDKLKLEIENSLTEKQIDSSASTPPLATPLTQPLNSPLTTTVISAEEPTTLTPVDSETPANIQPESIVVVPLATPLTQPLNSPLTTAVISAEEPTTLIPVDSKTPVNIQPESIVVVPVVPALPVVPTKTTKPTTAIDQSPLDDFPLLASILKQESKPLTQMKTEAYKEDESDTTITIDPGQKLLAQVMKSKQQAFNSPASKIKLPPVSVSASIVDPNNPKDANKQFNLGLKYIKGTLDIKQDYQQAYHWFKQSAEQGNAQAQLNLANMYFKGMGVNIDNISAYKWYEKSAEQGQPDAEFNLGFMHLNGLSTEKDTDTAIDYFKKSAKSGVAKAQLTLGIIYLEGNLLKQDLGQAAYWMQKSRVQGEAQAESIWNKYELWKYWKIES